jgi:hypothetical protein
MNKIWNYLREFESKELIKEYILKKYDYKINSGKAYEICAAFKQGRSYFRSALNADISVKPLLQYYGIVSLSRALILILNKESRENNIKPSHGLKIKNWSEISKSGKFENIILKPNFGTFTELIKATNNKTYLRAASGGINWHVEYVYLEEKLEFNLKELSYSFPDLKKSAEAWLGLEIPSVKLNTLKHINKTERELVVEGKADYKVIFPDLIFKNLRIEDNENGITSKINYNFPPAPHLTQKWDGILGIGDPYLIPPFNNLLFLNDISKMYAASFVFGTISRYYPSTWNDINSGLKNDRILPFAINLLDFIQIKYPQIITDFLNSPYKFEEE